MYNLHILVINIYTIFIYVPAGPIALIKKISIINICYQIVLYVYSYMSRYLKLVVGFLNYSHLYHISMPACL